MSADYPFPLSQKICRGVAEKFGTPVWLYHQPTIEKRVSEMSAFDVVRFAQKANSNLAILTLMRRLGVVVDAVSAGEMERALRAGFRPQATVPEIVYTADIFDRDALEFVRNHHIPVNIGSPDMLRQLAEAGIHTPITVRINPGFGHGHSRKTNTGGALSKHGIWYRYLRKIVQQGKDKGIPITGLHMHIGSGSDFGHLCLVCGAMLAAAKIVGPDLHTISAGGGLPIPYHKEEPFQRIDVNAYFRLWNDTRKQIEALVGHPVSLEVEPGRYLVAEAGYLVAQIRAVKKAAHNLFYIVDAGFSDLIRPAFYGAWHHISIVQANRTVKVPKVQAIVAGPLCESGDVFTQKEGGFVVQRLLPMAKVGDFLILHDVGAYGSAMSSNYNSRRLAPEVLWNRGHTHLIRERQSFDHLLALDKIPSYLV
ncbi:MAG TPA: diaminopimelate decarboxylase [Fibrobacteraceae bacterium]|nr:diaminopimelate decarboxylase [Fibrobacteraceae bacterium]